MKLTVLERFAAGNLVLPQQGNFATLKLVREGREALSFTAEELAKIKPVQEGSTVKWDNVAGMEIGEVDIKLNPFFHGLLKQELIKLNEKEQLPESYFSIYEKFVLNS